MCSCTKHPATLRATSCASLRTNSTWASAECWGYNRFYKISALLTEGFVDAEADALALEFLVRSPNFFQKCKELCWLVFCFGLTCFAAAVSVHD